MLFIPAVTGYPDETEDDGGAGENAADAAPAHDVRQGN